VRDHGPRPIGSHRLGRGDGLMLYDAVTVRQGRVMQFIEIEVTHKQACQAVAPMRGDTTAVVETGTARIGDRIETKDDLSDDW